MTASHHRLRARLATADRAAQAAVLARPVLAALACCALVALADVAIRTLQPTGAALGLWDWLGHVPTALLLWLALPARWRPTPLLLFLVASVAIDVDHLPGLLGGPTFAPSGRPASHALWVPLLLLALRQPVLAAGVCAHFVRDLCTGPGLPLAWPITFDTVGLPYLVYVGLLAALVGNVARAARATPPHGRGSRT